MIREILNRNKSPALTSDHWHVVHSRWSGDPAAGSNFVRSIVSEHEDRDSAATAARQIITSLAPEMATRPRKGRDQLFVRRPDYKSLKTAKRVKRHRK